MYDSVVQAEAGRHVAINSPGDHTHTTSGAGWQLLSTYHYIFMRFHPKYNIFYSDEPEKLTWNGIIYEETGLKAVL